jgi:hypothetical protein
MSEFKALKKEKFDEKEVKMHNILEENMKHRIEKVERT